MLISNTAQLTLLSLILMRMSGFILLNPLFGRRNVPLQIKAGIIMVLTLAVYSYYQGEAFQIESSIEYIFLLLKEFAAGYVVGFVMQLFFYVLTFTGYIMDFQMGLSMSTIFDPQLNVQIPITGSVFQSFFILLFFAVDGHLVLMKILLESAKIVPYGGILITQGLAEHILDLFLECTVMAVKFAMPLLAAEFLVEMGVGILNKMAPQINVFVINIQMKIIVGIGLLLILSTPFFDYLTKVLTTMIKAVEGILTFL